MTATDGFDVQADSPETEDVRALIGRHLAFAHQHTPPEGVFALDTAGLVAAGVSFFSIRDGDELLGIGALKQLEAGHAELKSMHTAEAARGRGVGRAMLAFLLDLARSRGCSRVSLETGSGPPFRPAHALYESAGFVRCEPFGDYQPSPNSVCMTLSLLPASPPD